MTYSASSQAAIAIVRRNTEEVQGKGDWAVFEQLFAPDFVDYAGRGWEAQNVEDFTSVPLLSSIRCWRVTAMSELRPEIIGWQAEDGDQG